MKRDGDLVREIQLELKQDPDWQFVEDDGDDDGGKRSYHRRLMADDGLLAWTGPYGYRLAAMGHHYLDAIRGEGIWQRTKRAVQGTGGSASLDIIKDLALGFLRKKIQHHTGVEIGKGARSPDRAPPLLASSQPYRRRLRSSVVP